MTISGLLTGLLETGEIVFVLCLLFGVLMLHPRTRRVIIAVTIFAKRHAPKWLAPVLIACAVIPGPVDEAIILVVVLCVCLRTDRMRRVFRRYVSYAWRK